MEGDAEHPPQHESEDHLEMIGGVPTGCTQGAEQGKIAAPTVYQMGMTLL
jgi:hypothetical protein